MNKKIITALSLGTLLFAACGEESTTQVTEVTEQVGATVVDAEKSLPECSDKNAGDLAVVTGEGLAYFCDGSKWARFASGTGADGVNGVNGSDGKDGVNGTDGKDGVNGTDGKDGVNGSDGKDGVNGTDGKDGENGKDGKDGKDGVGCSIVPSASDTLKVACGDDVTSIYVGGANSSAGGNGQTGGNASFGTLVDERDGQTYRTTKIGNQVWMAENLNFPVEGSICYDTNLVNCEFYGRLYEWKSALEACPSGWHLPSMEEFETLLENVGEDGYERYDNLAARSWTLGTDPYGFSALPAGYFGRTASSSALKSRYIGSSARFWSSTDNSGYYSTAYSLRMSDVEKEGGEHAASVSYNSGYDDKDARYSVRCLKD